MSTTEECVKRLRPTVEAMLAEGIETIFIVGALSELAVTCANHDRRFAVMNLEGAAKDLASAAKALRDVEASQQPKAV